MTTFDGPWYAGMIERFSPAGDDSQAESGRAVLAGFCILSQAIDGLTKAVEEVAKAIELSNEA